MNKVGKITVLVLLVVAVGVVIILKQEKSSHLITKTSALNTANTVQEEKIRSQLSNVEQSETLPKLVDLGADKCIPCKMMAPILEELKKEYAGVFDVEFIDVWKNPDAGKPYSIRVIPTQIFFDASGKELFRHEGFFSKEDILAKWKQFGVELTKTQ
jgi:thioredoxin 1